MDWQGRQLLDHAGPWLVEGPGPWLGSRHLVDVTQKRHNEDSYPRMIDGRVRIWPDLRFPAG